MAPLKLAAPMLLACALAIAGCGGSDDDGGPAAPGASEEGNERLFASSGFGEALDAVRERAGSDVQALRIKVTDAGAEFWLVRDGGPEVLVYTRGELAAKDAVVVGGAPGGGEFPLSEVDAGAVDALVAGVAGASAATGLEIRTMTLEPDAAGEARWTIAATASDNESLTYRARADGSSLKAADATSGQPGADAMPPLEAPATPEPAPEPVPAPPSEEEIEAVLECFEAAEGDVEQLQECANLIQP